MAKQFIEILKGVKIEITDRHLRKAGFARKVRLERRLMSPEERKTLLTQAAREARGNTKYTRLMLDEAVELSKVRGMKYAVKKTGIKHWSILGHKRRLAREGKYTPAPRRSHNNRYTMEQKRKCVELALALMRNGETVQKKILFPSRGKTIVMTRPKWTQRPAFVEAGRRLGMNGRSIEWQWTEGSIK